MVLALDTRLTAAVVAVASLAGAPVGSAPATATHPITGLPMSPRVAQLDPRNTTAAISETGWDALLKTAIERDELRRHRAEAARGRRGLTDWFFGTSGHEGLLPTLWDAFSYSPTDSRFDGYTGAMAAINTVNMLQWQRTYDPRPTAAVVTPPTAQLDVESADCGIAGPEIQVPVTDEHQGDVSNVVQFVSTGIANNLDFPQDAGASECGEWGADEDRVQTIKDQLLGGWPEHRVYVPWGSDKDSDSSLKQLVFGGMGQHRIQRVVSGDSTFPGATYAVYLGFLDAPEYEVRPGFSRLGADAYFDANGNPIGIAYKGTKYTPAGEQGYERTCTSKWKWNWWKPWKSRWVETCSGPVIGWQHAKMAFRGTLNAAVTLIDHLYGVHLVTANAIVTANVEELPPSHVIRRLMTPFGFRTEAINYQAAFALVNQNGLIHRASPFTVAGLEQIFEFARSAQSGITWATIPERRAAQNIGDIDGRPLPLVDDGTPFYAACLKLVRSYLLMYYADGRAEYDEVTPEGPDPCGADPHLIDWHRRVNSIAPTGDLPALTCANLEGVLATVIYLVTAGHTHVGALAGEVEDPCFSPWAWRDNGELCGTPRTSLTQALTFALTSLEQPLLNDDFSGVLDEEARPLWHTFQADLTAHGAVVEERNLARSRSFASFEPRNIEVSVGI
jgi:hypothetical protein